MAHDTKTNQPTLSQVGEADPTLNATGTGANHAATSYASPVEPDPSSDVVELLDERYPLRDGNFDQHFDDFIFRAHLCTEEEIVEWREYLVQLLTTKAAGSTLHLQVAYIVLMLCVFTRPGECLRCARPCGTEGDPWCDQCVAEHPGVTEWLRWGLRAADFDCVQYLHRIAGRNDQYSFGTEPAT